VVESFYDIGVALTEIARAKLYAADGHASLEAYLDAEKLLSPSQARKLIDIVKNIPRERGPRDRSRRYSTPRLASHEAQAARSKIVSRWNAR